MTKRQPEPIYSADGKPIIEGRRYWFARCWSRHLFQTPPEPCTAGITKDSLGKRSVRIRFDDGREKTWSPDGGDPCIFKSFTKARTHITRRMLKEADRLSSQATEIRDAAREIRSTRAPSL